MTLSKQLFYVAAKDSNATKYCMGTSLERIRAKFSFQGISNSIRHRIADANGDMETIRK